MFLLTRIVAGVRVTCLITKIFLLRRLSCPLAKSARAEFKYRSRIGLTDVAGPGVDRWRELFLFMSHGMERFTMLPGRVRRVC